MNCVDNQIELQVIDTGLGIPNEELPRMFDRFHRVPEARGRSIEGSGIGLSLIAELVRLHGGTISVASEVGKGSTFCVRIPRGFAHLPEASLDQDGTSGVALSTEREALLGEAREWDVDRISTAAAPVATGATVTHARIVLAEDNADLRNHIVGILARNYQVEATANGEEAWTAVQRQAPDIIVSDVMMPGISGIELLQRLRANPATRTTPVILLSARSGESEMLAGIEASAEDYLTKPFSSRELLARIRTHLAMAQARRKWAEELLCANQELEAFSYSVAHDLRAPLRAMDGFSKALLSSCGSSLDQTGKHYLERIRHGAMRMSALIDDLLALSQVSRSPLRRHHVDLGDLARQILGTQAERSPERNVTIEIAENMRVDCDPSLLSIALENLLGNAWKFTSRSVKASIVMHSEIVNGETTFCVRDNGVGLDMAHADKLFVPFQRLHSGADYPGTGIGLATVRRIIHRHNGRIWIDSIPGVGTNVHFTLGGGS